MGSKEQTLFCEALKFKGVWLRLREVFVCFAPPSLLLFVLFGMTSNCCKSIALETVAPIAQIFAGVFVTCIPSI